MGDKDHVFFSLTFQYIYDNQKQTLTTYVYRPDIGDSRRRDVRLSVHVWKPRFPVDWRLFVEERFANIAIPLDIFEFCSFDTFLRFDIFLVTLIFANQPTLHSGGVSRGSVRGSWRQ